MKIYRHQALKCRFVFGIFSLGFVLFSIISIKLAIAAYLAPFPQAILTLGGGSAREEFTAEFAQKHPSLAIWVSSGTTPQTARQTFQTAGISARRVHLDRRAADTVTNFTSLVADFQKLGFRHIYLITSDFHMPRAKAIATIVLGSQGITFTPVTVPSKQAPESRWRILRDVCRAVFWVVTGRTGASLDRP